MVIATLPPKGEKLYLVRVFLTTRDKEAVAIS